MRKLLWLLLCHAALAQAAPDEQALGKAQGYPLGTRERLAEHLVAGHRPEHLVSSFAGGLETLYPHRVVRKGDAPSTLKRAAEPTEFSYAFGAERLTTRQYLDRRRVTGLLVAHDGQIVLERYQYDRSETTRFLSASMAKSVTALLIGVAMSEGRIASLDDPARKYEPALAGHPYGDTSIKHLLQMSSGVRFTENYDGSDDVSGLIDKTVGQQGDGGAAAVRAFGTRTLDAGKKFAYSSNETQALGLVLRAATGMPVAEYLSTRIWQPMGAESDASWILDPSGQEVTFAFMHATLRDYARLGMLLADDGRFNGRQIVPAGWVREATQAVEPHVAPSTATPYFGYGYQFWVFPGDKRRFALIGARGQAIFVDPELKLVLVQTAVWKAARDSDARSELLALWSGVISHYQR